jgi:hypothetical protein
MLYGEHASGKTHTLIGGGNQRSIQQHPDKRGLLIRAAEDLFRASHWMDHVTLIFRRPSMSSHHSVYIHSRDPLFAAQSSSSS